MIRVVALGLLLGLAGCLYGAPTVYPPPPPVHMVWHPGHWRWDGAQWVYVRGHYVARRA